MALCHSNKLIWKGTLAFELCISCGIKAAQHTNRARFAGWSSILLIWSSEWGWVNVAKTIHTYMNVYRVHCGYF